MCERWVKWSRDVRRGFRKCIDKVIVAFLRVFLHHNTLCRTSANGFTPLILALLQNERMAWASVTGMQAMKTLSDSSYGSECQVPTGWRPMTHLANWPGRDALTCVSFLTASVAVLLMSCSSALLAARLA